MGKKQGVLRAGKFLASWKFFGGPQDDGFRRGGCFDASIRAATIRQPLPAQQLHYQKRIQPEDDAYRRPSRKAREGLVGELLHHSRAVGED